MPRREASNLPSGRRGTKLGVRSNFYPRQRVLKNSRTCGCPKFQPGTLKNDPSCQPAPKTSNPPPQPTTTAPTPPPYTEPTSTLQDPTTFCQGCSPGGVLTCMTISAGCYAISPLYNVEPSTTCTTTFGSPPKAHTHALTSSTENLQDYTGPDFFVGGPCFDCDHGAAVFSDRSSQLVKSLICSQLCPQLHPTPFPTICPLVFCVVICTWNPSIFTSGSVSGIINGFVCSQLLPGFRLCVVRIDRSDRDSPVLAVSLVVRLAGFWFISPVSDRNFSAIGNRTWYISDLYLCNNRAINS